MKITRNYDIFTMRVTSRTNHWHSTVHKYNTAVDLANAVWDYNGNSRVSCEYIDCAGRSSFFDDALGLIVAMRDHMSKQQSYAYWLFIQRAIAHKRSKTT